MQLATRFLKWVMLQITNGNQVLYEPLAFITYRKHKVKSFLSLTAHWAALISISLDLSQTLVFTLQDHGYGATALRGAPVYVPAFAGIHCAYPRRDGQAELTWVAGYIPGWSPIQVLTRPDVD